MRASAIDHFYDDRLTPFVIWPIIHAKGKPLKWRVAAYTLGWLWMSPMLLLVNLPFVLTVMIPLLIWQEIRDTA